jgi:hypothetical protein
MRKYKAKRAKAIRHIIEAIMDMAQSELHGNTKERDSDIVDAIDTAGNGIVDAIDKLTETIDRLIVAIGVNPDYPDDTEDTEEVPAKS